MIFSIGYSTRTLPEFLVELEKRHIGQIWDVRSSPWSRNTPFNSSQIEIWAPKAGLMYRKAGEVLGGNTKIALDDPRYLDALNHILGAASRENIVIMCSEGDPAKCHRTWDIAASLLSRHGVLVRSILRDGEEEDASATLKRVFHRDLPADIRDFLAGEPRLFGREIGFVK